MREALGRNEKKEPPIHQREKKKIMKGKETSRMNESPCHPKYSSSLWPVPSEFRKAETGQRFSLIKNIQGHSCLSPDRFGCQPGDVSGHSHTKTLTHTDSTLFWELTRISYISWCICIVKLQSYRRTFLIFS